MLRLVTFLLVVSSSLAIKLIDIQEHTSTAPICKEAGCNEGQICLIFENDSGLIAECGNKDKEQVLRHILQHPINHGHRHAEGHAQHDNLGEHVCSIAELNAMGGRFLQWFSDIHQQVGGVDKSLSGHHYSCRKDVAWMFLQWDGDENGYLTKEEVLPILKGGKEQCVAQFLDRCDDIEVDNRLSLDEWCDCFTFSDDLRHEPPCHKEKHTADPHLLGVYLPRCDLEGFYRPEQCHEGSCWCVDKYGREFDKSRVEQELPDCGQYASLTKEEEEELRARL